MQEDNGRIYFEARIDNSKMQRDAEQSKNILHGIGDTAKQVGMAMAGMFALDSAKTFVQQVATIRGEMQKLELAFTTMLGSKEKSDKLMSELLHTAATTPFSSQDVMSGAKQLLAFGESAETVNDTLIRLGDIAAGTGANIGQLTLVYGQIMASGKMMSNDAYQFINAGVPIFDALAQSMNVATSEVKELISQGKVGFPEVQAAIKSLTDEGSKFGGMMEAQSKTITGLWSTLKDNIELMFNDIGKNTEGIMTGAIESVMNLVANYKEVGKTIAEIAAVYGTYKAAVMGIAAAHKAQIAWATATRTATLVLGASETGVTAIEVSRIAVLQKLRAAQAALNATMLANPYVLLATTIAAAGAAMFELGKRISDVDSRANELKKEIEDLKKKHEEERKEVEKNIAIAQDVKKSLKERKEAIDTLKSIMPEYFKNLDIETAKTYKVAEALRAQRDEMKKNLEVKLRLEKEALQEAKDYYEGMQKQSSGSVYGASQSNVALLNDAKYEVERRQKAVETLKGALKDLGDVEKKSTSKAAEDAGKSIDSLTEKIKNLNNERNKTTDESKRKSLAKEIEKLEAEKLALDNQGRTNPKGSKDNTKKESQHTEDEITARTKAIKDYEDKVGLQIRETELNLRAEQIDIMKDGVDKTIKQIDLNYDRMILVNDKRAQEFVKSFADMKTNEWQNANPKATKKQVENHKESLVTEYSQVFTLKGAEQVEKLQDILKGLDSEQKEVFERVFAQINAYTVNAEEIRANEIKKANEDLLSEILTYEQKRTQIQEEFAKKRESLYEKDADGNVTSKLREGVTQGNVDELNRQSEEALKAVDEQFASRSETYEAWCNELTNETLRKLKEMLTQAEAELKKAENTGGATAEQRAKVSKLKATISKEEAKINTSPDKRSVKEWGELQKVLNETANQFKGLGEQIGGTAGEVLSSAGTITTSTVAMINGILSLVQGSTIATEGMSRAAVTAIKTVETASVILAVISAALQVATAIANLFSSDKAREKERESLQTRIDQLQWEIDHAGDLKMFEMDATPLEVIKQIAFETTEELKQLRQELSKSPEKTQEYMEKVYEYSQNKGEAYEKTIEAIVKHYADMTYMQNKLMSKDTFANSRQQLEKYAKQLEDLKDQYDTIGGKDKDKVEKQKTEVEQNMVEVTSKMEAVINDMLEDIMGGSFQDLASELGDALFDAFKDGEDAAKAWGDKVNDIVGEIMKKMIIQQYLEEPMGKLFDKYRERLFPNGDGSNAISETLSAWQELSDELNGLRDNVEQGLSYMPEDMVKTLWSSDSEREGASKGIASASQESIDELNGRMTAVQGHTFDISANTKIIMDTTNDILTHVANIDDSTATMKSDIRKMKSDISDMNTRGIKIN